MSIQIRQSLTIPVESGDPENERPVKTYSYDDVADCGEIEGLLVDLSSFFCPVHDLPSGKLRAMFSQILLLIVVEVFRSSTSSMVRLTIHGSTRSTSGLR